MTGGDFDPDWTMHPGVHWREMIEHSGLSVTEVAQAIGMSRPFLSNVLAGRALPPAGRTVAFARFFDVQPRFLWQLRVNYELDLALGKKDVTQ